MLSDGPLVFGRSPLPWHKAVYAHFADLIVQDRVPHALLISGSTGAGQAMLATLMAATLLCHERFTELARVLPCGTCGGCRLIESGVHGDYQMLGPEEGKRAIGIDAVRKAIGFLQQTTTFGLRKVLVISPAEAMTHAAANALLKVLEEPPGNGYLLLVSDRPGDLPATIRSRCQRLQCLPADPVAAVPWLTEQSAGSETQALDALRVCNGDVMAALSCLKNDALTARVKLRQCLIDLFSGNVGPMAALSVLSAYDTELVFQTALVLLEQACRDANRQQLKQRRVAFECHDQIRGWLVDLRRGVNLAKDNLIMEFTHISANALNGRPR